MRTSGARRSVHGVGLGPLATGSLTLLGLLFLRQAYGRMRRPQGNDLTLRLAGARSLLRGEDPYAVPMPQTHGPAPLTADLLAVPLTFLPEWLAQALWFALNAAALVTALRVLERLWCDAARGPNPVLAIPFPARLLAVTLAIFVPLQSQMTLGQTNLLLLLGCCLFVQAHLADRPGPASLALGGAIALKLVPAVFLAALARERRLRTLALTVGAVAVWGVLLPALASRRVLALYRSGWWPLVRAHLGGPVRFERRSRFALAALIGHVWPPASSIPGLRLWTGLATLAPVLWLQGRLGADRRGRLLVFALYLVTMPLLSPMSETHHLAVLAAPLWLWWLRAGEDPGHRLLDLVGGGLFLGFHWLAVPRRASPLDALALLGLYAVLFLRALSLRAGPRTLGGSQGTPPPSAAGPQAT